MSDQSSSGAPMSGLPLSIPMERGLGGGALPDPLERLRAALASAAAGGESGGIGCHFWTNSQYGVPVDQLHLLGLVVPIKTRIPLCEEHGCALLETCPQRAIFAQKQPGRASLKFRLTEPGSRAAVEPHLVAEQLAEQPIPSLILAALAEAGGPLNWLTLYWRLLEPELSALAETGQRPIPPLSRPAVRFYLDLLVAVGLLVEDPAAGLVSLPDVSSVDSADLSPLSRSAGEGLGEGASRATT